MSLLRIDKYISLSIRTIPCRVYNVTSGGHFPEFTFKSILDDLLVHAEKIPTKKQIRPIIKKFTGEVQSSWFFEVELFIYHTLFALVADILLFSMGISKRLVPILVRSHPRSSIYSVGKFHVSRWNVHLQKTMKMNKLLRKIGHLLQHKWNVTVDNYIEQVEAMTEEDLQSLPCDLTKLDIDQYLLNAFLGSRKYILSEDETDIPAAKKRRKM
jgi:hypothetical protein